MMSLDEFLKQWHSADEFVEVQTSGSTGAPKRLMVEKKRMLASAAMTCDFLALNNGDKALLCLPLDYIAGKMMVVRALYRNLNLISVEPDGHPLAQTGDVDFDFAAMVPLQVFNSLSVPSEYKRLARIKHLIIGGGPVDDDLARRLSDMPNWIWSTYGMTETLSHIAMRRINGPDADEWYTPLRNVRVNIDNDSRLCIFAPDICAEQLVTNDIAEISPDGRFKILGRIDNVICCGGVKMQIETIEKLLKDVLPCEFMVTSRPDSKFGEVPVLLHVSSQEGDIIDICARALPKYMRPKHYIYIDNLPTTLTGKPARAVARQIAIEKGYPFGIQ